MTHQYSIEPDIWADRQIGQVMIGRGSYSGLASFVTWTPSEPIVIGRYCSIADDVFIMTGGQHNSRLPSTWPFENFIDGKQNPSRTYRSISDTVIGSDVWIGRGAHISNAAHVHHGAVVGAEAVVTSDVPPYAIVTGNRAQISGFRFDERTVEQLLRIAWWEWPAELIVERREHFYEPISMFVQRYDNDTIR